MTKIAKTNWKGYFCKRNLKHPLRLIWVSNRKKTFRPITLPVMGQFYYILQIYLHNNQKITNLVAAKTLIWSLHSREVPDWGFTLQSGIILFALNKMMHSSQLKQHLYPRKPLIKNNTAKVIS